MLDYICLLAIQDHMRNELDLADTKSRSRNRPAWRHAFAASLRTIADRIDITEVTVPAAKQLCGRAPFAPLA